MVLTKKQEEQVKLQIEGHKHNKYTIDLKIAKDKILRDFVVYLNILRPEKMVALKK